MRVVGKHVIYVIYTPNRAELDVYEKDTIAGREFLGAFLMHVEVPAPATAKDWIKAMEKELRPRAEALVSLRHAATVARAWADRTVRNQPPLPEEGETDEQDS